MRVNTGEVICGIYKITNKLSGKYYIGQSVDINYRFYEHNIFLGKQHNSAIDSAIQKYGKENFEYEILEVCEPEDLFNRELYWAETVFNGRCYAPFGYNIDRCGRGHRKVRFVSSYDKDGNKIKTYVTTGDAARELGVSTVAIRRAIKDNGLCCDMMWKYGVDENISSYKSPTFGIGIDAYDKDGNKCLHFNNGVEASMFFGITTTAISSYINHKSGYVCCNGYYLTKEGESPIIRENRRVDVYNPCYEYDLSTHHLIKEYYNVVQASKNRDSKSIRNALNGTQLKAYGSIWSHIKWDIAPDNYRELNKNFVKSKQSKEGEFN